VIEEAQLDRFSPETRAKIRAAIDAMVANGYNRMNLMLLQSGDVVYDAESHENRLIHRSWQQLCGARPEARKHRQP
jgi:hypothetical protein